MDIVVFGQTKLFPLLFDPFVKPLLRVGRKRRLTYVNGVTFARAIAAPFFGLWFYSLGRDHASAASWTIYAILLTLLMLSDGFDGYASRLLDVETDFGAQADPVADKLLMFSIITPALSLLDPSGITGSLRFTLSWLIILRLALDGLLIGAAAVGFVFRRLLHRKVSVKANRWGKIKFTIDCCVMIWISIGFAAFGSSGANLSKWLVPACLAIAAACGFAVASLIGHYRSLRSSALPGVSASS